MSEWKSVQLTAHLGYVARSVPVPEGRGAPEVVVRTTGYVPVIFALVEAAKTLNNSTMPYIMRVEWYRLVLY